MFAGAMPSKVLRVFNNMNIQTFNVATFFNHQRHYLLPAIDTVWEESVSTMYKNIVRRGCSVNLAGDGRSDSPGHNAKYGSYTSIDLDTGKVLDIQLVQSNEVNGSTNMEKEGLRRMVEKLERHGIHAKLLITDRHLQIQKWIREYLPTTKHCYDVWHVAKAVKKKLLAIAKRKGNEDVSNWVKSISNHLYWCAASTEDGDGEMVVSKWKSVANHVQNVHSGHEGLYHTCTHSNLEQRQWLQPSTQACSNVEDFVTGTRLCNDIRKLSTQHQTSDLEAFHSVINQFAPKLYSFQFNPQMCRLKIAAMHFNENSHRGDAKTKCGKQRYKTSFPKFKKGEFSVRPVPKEQTFSYVDKLLREVVRRSYLNLNTVLNTPVPPPLCSGMTRPSPNMNKTTRYRKRCDT